MKILCFDQASRRTAFSVGENGKLTDYGMILASGDGDNRIFEMTDLIKRKITEIAPDLVILENIQLQSGNVKTYQMLARLQGMIIYNVIKFGIPYKIVPPVTWKSHCGFAKNKRDFQKQASIKYAESRFNVELENNDDLADSMNILAYAVDCLG